MKINPYHVIVPLAIAAAFLVFGWQFGQIPTTASSRLNEHVKSSPDIRHGHDQTSAGVSAGSTRSRFLTTAEKRELKAAKEAEIQAVLIEEAARYGQTTNQAWPRIEARYYPERVRIRHEAQLNELREQGLAAGGVQAQTWKREAELEVLSKQLAKGMSISEITNVLGMPFRAETRIVTNRMSDLFPVPLDQLEIPRQNLSLIFSPHPVKDHHSGRDEWRILTVFLNDKQQLTGWRYEPPAGSW